MKDRIPKDPGRVLITPENGSTPFYATMTRADNPEQEGTPLNKNSLLKDETAALFGLDADAVPDDVLAIIKTLIASNKALASSKSQIATGSYMGTGTYGASNPCRLTFGFKPVIVFLYPDQNCDISHHSSNPNTDPYAIRFGVTTKFYDNSTAAYHNKLSYTGNTMSWYCTGGSGASTQLNYSGWKYYYVAIG